MFIRINFMHFVCLAVVWSLDGHKDDGFFIPLTVSICGVLSSEFFLQNFEIPITIVFHE